MGGHHGGKGVLLQSWGVGVHFGSLVVSQVGGSVPPVGPVGSVPPEKDLSLCFVSFCFVSLGLPVLSSFAKDN